MSDQVLQDLDNIKIPYPTEGVIRTAQLDDTIAPLNSVQLAVNMNFDTIGAMQTRPGVTSYADSLAEKINSFGKLHNELIPPGYAGIFQLGSTDEIVTSTFQNPVAVKVSDTKVAVFWTDADGFGVCRNISVDETTGAYAVIGTPLTFDGAHAGNKAVLSIDANVVLLAWQGEGSDGWANGFNVTGDTITQGTAYEFDTSDGDFPTLALVDSTHAICFYEGTSSHGIATIFEINVSTLAVTQPGSPTTYETTLAQDNSCVALGDGIHFLNFWGHPGKAQCFSVNTGTWAITAIGSPLTFASVAGTQNHALAGSDGQHFVDVFVDDTGSFVAQAFNVNLSTFAVTTVGTPVNIKTGGGNDLNAVGFGDGFHFVSFYSVNAGDGFVQMFEMDPITFNMSLIGAPLAGYDFANPGFTFGFELTTHKVGVVWGTPTNGATGNAAMFTALGDLVEGRWLYAGHTDKVSNTTNGTWTVRRSGLAQVSKPRFAQYLNYLWMVNGNDQIGGDPVATSNGGNFGTDLVPVGFPKGDYISAGFEGRVWVADKTLGIIHYSDIVQFEPPIQYILTYNPAVDFISTLAPQTGETFTGLFEVPRALLVFTQNTITRIYGASSVDAYAAYNVGTYSQESIVQTKTGIFFHHSSGFYQFNYGGQPVEISRRIIDFVKAIPRSYYPDITGVYDGFDNVEWSIGPVTVEGVTFSNCVVRYTISTQVWTIYDYTGNVITAMISYDDGTVLNHLIGTEAGKTGALDTGTTDFGEPFYFEFIDRWRAYTDMYYITKRIDGVNIYHENAAGANLSYQCDHAGANVWTPIGSVTSENISILPNDNSQDFSVARLRLAGNTKGTRVIIHGIELLQITIKGQKRN